MHITYMPIQVILTDDAVNSLRHGPRALVGRMQACVELVCTRSSSLSVVSLRRFQQKFFANAGVDRMPPRLSAVHKSGGDVGMSKMSKPCTISSPRSSIVNTDDTFLSSSLSLPDEPGVNCRDFQKFEINFKRWASEYSQNPDLKPDHKITMLDISSLGEIKEWSVEIPVDAGAEPCLAHSWKQSARAKLRPSRIIVFDETLGGWVRELIGDDYSVDLALFSDIALSLTGFEERYKNRTGPTPTTGTRIDWADCDDRRLEYVIGLPTTYLSLGSGWTAKVVSHQPDHLGDLKHTSELSSCHRRLRMHRPTNMSLVMVAASRRRVHSGMMWALHQSSTVGYRPEWCNQQSVEGHTGAYSAEAFCMSICRWSHSLHLAAQADPLLYLLPILDIETTLLGVNLTDADHRLRAALINEDDCFGSTQNACNMLNRLKHEGDRVFDRFIQYDAECNGGRTQRHERFLQLHRRCQRIMSAVIKIEQKAREYQQAHAALKGVQAAAKSIENSKMSLKESKRINVSKSYTQNARFISWWQAGSLCLSQSRRSPFSSSR
jgi:hypothetical protein